MILEHLIGLESKDALGDEWGRVKTAQDAAHCTSIRTAQTKQQEPDKVPRGDSRPTPGWLRDSAVCSAGTCLQGPGYGPKRQCQHP